MSDWYEHFEMWILTETAKLDTKNKPLQHLAILFFLTRYIYQRFYLYSLCRQEKGYRCNRKLYFNWIIYLFFLILDEKKTENGFQIWGTTVDKNQAKWTIKHHLLLKENGEK